MPRLTTKKQVKTTVSIVGSGRLGTALALALASSGYSIAAVVARRRASGRKTAALIGRPTLALTANQLNLLPPSEIILITTPDDVIEATAVNLAKVQGLQNDKAAGQTVVHTSGALSSAVLAPLSEKDFHVGSLHPLVAVSDPVKGAQALRGAFWCIEGDKTAARVAGLIVRNLKGQSFSVSQDKKPLYHAAAVMASGHFVALFDIAIEMLAACGLSKARAREVLLPLLRSTVENLATREPARALTGTFMRGDAETVRRHLCAFDGLEVRDALDAYILLGRRSVRLARTLNGDSASLRTIADTLSRVERDLPGSIKVDDEISLVEQVLRYEGELIKRALQASGGRITPAARLLRISHQGLDYMITGRHKELLAVRKVKRPRSPKGVRAPHKRP